MTSAGVSPQALAAQWCPLTIDDRHTHTAVFLADGIGITPFLAMTSARNAASSGRLFA